MRNDWENAHLSQGHTVDKADMEQHQCVAATWGFDFRPMQYDSRNRTWPGQHKMRTGQYTQCSESLTHLNPNTPSSIQHTLNLHDAQLCSCTHCTVDVCALSHSACMKRWWRAQALLCNLSVHDMLVTASRCWAVDTGSVSVACWG